MDSSDSSLKQIYQQAKSSQADLEHFDPSGAAYKSALRSAIDQLQRCRALVDQLAIFSVNEDVEDISTENLRYLTIEYSLADLMIKSYEGDRQTKLRESSELLEHFLKRLDAYEILSTADRKLLERYQSSRETFSLVSDSNSEERRKVKVARFQEEKLLKQKLEYLRNQTKAVNVDDEVIRNLHLAEISLAVNQTYQNLDLMTQENRILSHMRQSEPPKLSPDAVRDERSPARLNQYSERLDGPMFNQGLGRKGGPLLSPSGKPMQPFTLTDKRTQLQQGVFRPGHSLPTMSIDEYLEEERRRGGIIDGGGNADQPAAKLDEDDMEKVDEATMKAREWDEYVESHPKGAGNTLNRG